MPIHNQNKQLSQGLVNMHNYLTSAYKGSTTDIETAVPTALRYILISYNSTLLNLNYHHNHFTALFPGPPG